MLLRRWFAVLNPIFPRRECQRQRKSAPTYCLANFPQELGEVKKYILGVDGRVPCILYIRN